MLQSRKKKLRKRAVLSFMDNINLCIFRVMCRYQLCDTYLSLESRAWKVYKNNTFQIVHFKKGNRSRKIMTCKNLTQLSDEKANNKSVVFGHPSHYIFLSWFIFNWCSNFPSIKLIPTYTLTRNVWVCLISYSIAIKVSFQTFVLLIHS